MDAFVSPINMTSAYISRISKGDFPDEITEEYKGDFNEIRKSINLLISNLRGTVQMAEKIAEGDLTVRVNTLSDRDMLGKSLTRMVKTIKMIVGNISLLTNAALEGKLGTRGDSGRFGGEYARIIRGVNKTLDAVVTPLRTTAMYVDRISKGNIPEPIGDEYRGDFNNIRVSLNTMIRNLIRFAEAAERVARRHRATEQQRGPDFPRNI
ncbi:HAMP domain-containing protein [Desulfococcaceae bacterium HSG8]|nr:HAMP domain-containing protein [Desulfococcaceae bacterium HSG8]